VTASAALGLRSEHRGGDATTEIADHFSTEKVVIGRGETGIPPNPLALLQGDTFGSMTERETSAGDGSRPKTRYHLLATDGGIVPDQPGEMTGEAAIGVVLKAPLEEISEPIGPVKDHHVAEYRALIRGLEAARSRGIEHLRVCLDSALVVDQLNGRSQVKAEHLKPWNEQAVSLIEQFADIEITWVPREATTEAHALASAPLAPLRRKPKPSIDELPLDSAGPSAPVR
jgi:ribonuclease HI